MRHDEELIDLEAARQLRPLIRPEAACPPDDKDRVIDYDEARRRWLAKPPGRAAGDYRALRHLMAKEFPPVPWLVAGLLPLGLAILAGPPKVGKSWLALDLSLAISRGGAALAALPCDTGRVLYYALEDSESRLADRINHLWPDSLELSILWDYHLSVDPMPAFLEHLDRSLADRPDTRLVVVDTYGRISEDKGARASYRSDYGESARLQEMALKHGVCLLLIHHTRKGLSSDPFEDISGTYGITGAADTLLVLVAPPGEADAKLHVRGRDVEYRVLSLKLDDGQWRYQGEAQVVQRTQEELAILTLLAGSSCGLTLAQLNSRLEVSKSALHKRLQRMRSRGLVTLGADKHWVKCPV